MNLISLTGSLRVAPLALGTGHFGTKLTEADAFAQLDRYAEFGNFIDTARVYGDDPSGERSKSERIIGKWLRANGMAGQMILSTKGGHPTPGKNRAFTPRLHRDELYADVEGSLDFLGVDAIDLYFLHRDDTSLPVGEILETLEEMRRKGLIRFYGCSNWTVERITAAAAYARAHSLAGFSVNQTMWSLAEVDFQNPTDKTLVPMDRAAYAYHTQTQMGAMAYSALAKGWFTRKAAGLAPNERIRPRYDLPANDMILEQLQQLSRQTGLGITQLSLAYFLGQPFPSVPICAFSDSRQLEDGLSILRNETNPELARQLAALRRDLIGG